MQDLIPYKGMSMMVYIDEIDREIINYIQSNFPVEPYPYSTIAKVLGIEEEEAWRRINQLKSKGFIRRIGAIFNSNKLGFFSTLIGVKTDTAAIKGIAEKINKLPGVTHHYQRDDDYNLWFTLTARSQKIIDEIVQKVREWEGVRNVINLPSTKTFKIKVDFQISGF